MPEAEPLSPRKTAVVLLIVGGCFAVLWPRLLQPALLGRADPTIPNSADRAQGCCDVIFEKDVNAIKIMIELCGNILEKKRGPLDTRTASAFSSGKLPPDIIAACRSEVNSTCGVDISTFLQQNVKLGKTYKQILEEVRSYNSSACLKMHFGVPTWALGSAHVGKAWTVHELDNIKQERPPHSRPGAPHPAMLERGRAIPDTKPPPARTPIPEMVKRAEGRVRSPLSVYYTEDEPPPVPGVRPPLGGAGGALPPPKSSVGFVMPVYTICIVVFFVYTLCKILFKRTDSTGGNYESVTPDPTFRRRVFEDRQPSRASPDTKLVVSAISGLVAEVQQQMEANYAQSHRANGAQVPQTDSNVPYTNGTLHHKREASPVRIIAKEFKEVTPEPIGENIYHKAKEQVTKFDKAHEFESNNLTVATEEIPKSKEISLELKENASESKVQTSEPKEYSPEPKEQTPEPIEQTPEPKERTPEPKERTPEPIEQTPELKEQTRDLKEKTPEPKEHTPDLMKENHYPKESTVEPRTTSPELETRGKNSDIKESETKFIEDNRQATTDFLADAIKDELNKKDNGDLANGKLDHDEKLEDIEDVLSEEEIEYEVEEEEEDESPIVRQLRASVENEKATVKVLGMEMTAHCEGGAVWGDRPLSPPALPRPPPPPPHRPHEAPEVSSIYLEGDIPQQSRLLVTDKVTREDTASPVVLSGKMTLSLINDGGEGTPEREPESTADDDDFTTASAYTQPKLNQQEEELSEEEIEEEVEVEEIEEEELDEKEEMVPSGGE